MRLYVLRICNTIFLLFFFSKTLAPWVYLVCYINRAHYAFSVHIEFSVNAEIKSREKHLCGSKKLHRRRSSDYYNGANVTVGNYLSFNNFFFFL